MFTIGEFATVGRVSVRMLRHYDAVGLLTPRRVDERTGYRSYAADQLRQLNRLLALKDLGFTLEQVRQILAEEVDAAAMRGMLRLRQAELAEQIDADRQRLARVEARLRIIEREGTMNATDVTITTIEPVRVVELSAPAASTAHEDVGPVVSGLFGELMGRVQASGATLPGGAVAWYVPLEGGGLECHAGLALDDGQPPPADLEAVDLPRLERAATLRHHGRMDTITGSYQQLAVWIEENGYRTDGTARELYLVTHPEPQDSWVTELQMAISPT